MIFFFKFFVISNEETCPQTIPFQIYDSTQSRGVVKHRRSFNINWHHDLDTWQIFSLQRQE